ncbi:pyocin knob domain-containing protein [Flavobacterium sp.]|uniref:pyocin knob domain-containing protein n=1 Tax=Flavobacterium sp. TaxID=239 RepID=UPI0025B9B5DF|nr:pyocin knob domain-containing protein [Flavobacterium sp.]
MKKTLTTLAILFVAGVSFSQQIGSGYGPSIPDFNLALKSGVYSGQNPTGTTSDANYSGWQHLFVLRHDNPDSNHQLQIASSFSTNDRLFFRKIAVLGSTSPSNPSWIELATRGANTFAGNQIINGNVGIGTETPIGLLDIRKTTLNAGGKSIVNIIGSTWAGDGAALVLTQLWNDRSYKTNIDNFGSDQNMVGSGLRVQTSYWDGSKVETITPLTLTPVGNLGLGVINPQNKLDVNGAIHSKEVKVDMLGWSDFVFKKEYTLPTLAEVEKHIKEKGHLENIPNEEEVLKNGINLGEMNAKLLQKIEELTLYMIDMKKENDQMKTDNLEMKKRLINLENK